MESTFARRLRSLRERAGLTQRELGRMLGKSESAVRMWELSKSEPDHETLLALGRHFGVGVDLLIGGGDGDLSDEIDEVLKLKGIYLRLAKEAQEMKLDERDIENIINLYKNHLRKNKT